MTDSPAIWNLHLIYRLSHLPDHFAADVHDQVRALEGVAIVASAPSHDASTRLAFSTCSTHAAVAAVAAKQCLHAAIAAHNATKWWWQQKVRLVNEPAVRKVGERSGGATA